MTRSARREKPRRQIRNGSQLRFRPSTSVRGNYHVALFLDLLQNRFDMNLPCLSEPWCISATLLATSWGKCAESLLNPRPKWVMRPRANSQKVRWELGRGGDWGRMAARIGLTSGRRRHALAHLQAQRFGLEAAQIGLYGKPLRLRQSGAGPQRCFEQRSLGVRAGGARKTLHRL